jgi:hypothetical protein
VGLDEVKELGEILHAANAVDVERIIEVLTIAQLRTTAWKKGGEVGRDSDEDGNSFVVLREVLGKTSVVLIQINLNQVELSERKPVR